MRVKDNSDQRGRACCVTDACGETVADDVRAAALAERRRLACDLHDSVTQTLISLHLSAQAAADLWDTQPVRARAALDTVCHLAAGATTEMRAVLVDLHDAVLERRGLVAALEAHCAVVGHCSGLQVGVRFDGAGAQMPAAYERAICRIVREALANVVKHARASRATVTLTRDRTVRVCIEDDGVGFDTSTEPFTYGLVGMRERVAALGGWLHLDSQPTRGARVVVELPVPDDLSM
jgi:signal transduction histidine kinase